MLQMEDGRAVHVLLAPDGFKGSLPAAAVCTALADGLRTAHPGIGSTACPVADGGEGTLDVMLRNGFTRRPVRVRGPLGDAVDAAFATRGDVAVVELASASGLVLVTPQRRDPLRASSFGTGQLVAAALDRGCRRIVLAVGGSASTDGGVGLVQALGARPLDADGRVLEPGGAALNRLARLDLSALDPRLRQAELVVATDVTNPLLGPDGAAAVYGPQKGAGAQDVGMLEAGLRRLVSVTVPAAAGRGPAALPGTGAAGGVGFAATHLLGGTLRSGTDLVLDLVGFDTLVQDATLVVTGEGRLDRQTLRGKAPFGVARRAGRAGVPVVAVCGSTDLSPAQVTALGLDRVWALSDLEPDLGTCIREPVPLLRETGRRIGQQLVTTARGH